MSGSSAALGRQHDLRLRLISDEEPFDGSVHHDVLVRGAGQPTVSLSLAAGPGLPWPLRGMSRSNEFDLVEVDGEKTTVAQAVACLDAVFDDVRLMRTVVDSALVDQEIDRLGLELTGDELQAATEAYRRARCLYTAEDTAAWLAGRGLTPALFARQVEQHALVAKLRGHVAGPGVAAWLDAHAADLGMVVAAWATGPVERLRAEPVAAVAAAWRDGGRGGLEQWRIGELPAGFAALRTAAVGDLLEVDGGAAHALVVDRRAPDTDGESTALAERALFADWLAGRRAAARITWYWGTAGRPTGWTMRAGRRRRVPTVLQSTRYDCGPACLSAVLAAFGRRVPLPALRASLDPGRDGISALELRDEAIAHGLDCRGRRAADIAALTRLPLPLVAHWESDHYVVVTAVASKHVEVMDPAIGRRRIPHAEYLAATNGIVLTFAATSEPGPRSGPPATPTGGHPARSVVRSVVVPCLLADRAALARLAVTSLLLLGLGLVVPLLTARVVDAFAARGGASNGPASLTLVAGGVLAAATVLTQARGLATALLQRRIGERLTTTLFERMLRAPLQFIERRGPGELVGRVQSGDILRDALANRLIGAVLDAAVGVVYLGVVLVAAPAVVQVAALGVLGRRGRMLRREELVAQAKYGSWVYEAASTIAWVKGSGAEDVIGARAARLRGRQLDALHRAGRNDALAQAVASAVRTAGPLVLLVAVTATAAGASVGRAVALATLAAAAAVPLGNIAVNLRELYEIGSVLDHLQDLVNAPAESAGSEVPAGPEGGRRIDRLDGTVTATDLCFRFTHRDPWVVERMSFHVPRGAKLAIVGPSGSGKSTLAKLLVGLYPPTSGTVAVDGHDLRTLDLPAVRRLIGVVWQEPQLFSGTIWENVSLRVPGAAPAEVQEAVRLAAIDEEIAAMPLGYATGLGPSGEGLSGGQRQRLGLARALVGRPALLVLDEATSHLDAPAEARVEQNLRSAGVTRIVIAHRLSTVQDADLILVVVGGRIVERGTHEELLAWGEVYPAMVRAQQSGPGTGSVRLDRGPGSPGERSNGYALELR